MPELRASFPKASEHRLADTESRERIDDSIRKYRRVYRRYECRHPEIFNPIEQQRLRGELARTLEGLPAKAKPATLLDLGCGSGNVTKHALELGCSVTAADVTPQFLRLVKRRFGNPDSLRTVRLNGEDLAGIGDASHDVVCAYSVLHHIPDYVAIVTEACRVLRPGGLLFLDHEANENFWDKESCFWRLLDDLEQWHLDRKVRWNPYRRRWQRFLMPSKYYVRLRRAFDPGYPLNIEGDIHVWDWDHIEWPLIEACVAAHGCVVERRRDYLCYSPEYPDEIWDRYGANCTNMRLLVARKVPG